MPESFEFDVFLSHGSRGKAAVRELAERLKGDGCGWVGDPAQRFDPASHRTGVGKLADVGPGHEPVRVRVRMGHARRYTALFRDPTNQQRRFIPRRQATYLRIFRPQISAYLIDLE